MESRWVRLLSFLLASKKETGSAKTDLSNCLVFCFSPIAVRLGLTLYDIVYTTLKNLKSQLTNHNSQIELKHPKCRNFETLELWNIGTLELRNQANLPPLSLIP